MDRYKIASDVFATEADGGMSVLLKYETGDFYTLDEVGTFIWTRLDKEQALEDIVASLCSEYDVGPQQAYRDIEQLVETLIQNGLVTR